MNDSSPAAGKQESEQKRLTRNLNELLQELRVTQTGVQILTGFLLTVPFSSRFDELDAVQRYAYLAVLSGSVIATGFIVGPVAFHRLLFRKGERRWLVGAANHSARLGLLLLALTSSGVIWLVFDIVLGRTEATVAGGLTLAFFAALWAGVPVLGHNRDGDAA
jgi:hypothetical protein